MNGEHHGGHDQRALQSHQGQARRNEESEQEPRPRRAEEGVSMSRLQVEQRPPEQRML